MVSEVKDKRNSNETTTEQTNRSMYSSLKKSTKPKLCVYYCKILIVHTLRSMYANVFTYILTTLNGIKIVHKLS